MKYMIYAFNYYPYTGYDISKQTKFFIIAALWFMLFI